jgi:hypothetical protein
LTSLGSRRFQDLRKRRKFYAYQCKEFKIMRTLHFLRSKKVTRQLSTDSLSLLD